MYTLLDLEFRVGVVFYDTGEPGETEDRNCQPHETNEVIGATKIFLGKVNLSSIVTYGNTILHEEYANDYKQGTKEPTHRGKIQITNIKFQTNHKHQIPQCIF